jgi:hypothetical protein
MDAISTRDIASRVPPNWDKSETVARPSACAVWRICSGFSRVGRLAWRWAASRRSARRRIGRKHVKIADRRPQLACDQSHIGRANPDYPSRRYREGWPFSARNCWPLFGGAFFSNSRSRRACVRDAQSRPNRRKDFSLIQRDLVRPGVRAWLILAFHEDGRKGVPLLSHLEQAPLVFTLEPVRYFKACLSMRKATRGVLQHFQIVSRHRARPTLRPNFAARISSSGAGCKLGLIRRKMRKVGMTCSQTYLQFAVSNAGELRSRPSSFERIRQVLRRFCDRRSILRGLAAAALRGYFALRP